MMSVISGHGQSLSLNHLGLIDRTELQQISKDEEIVRTVCKKFLYVS